MARFRTAMLMALVIHVFEKDWGMWTLAVLAFCAVYAILMQRMDHPT